MNPDPVKLVTIFWFFFISNLQWWWAKLISPGVAPGTEVGDAFMGCVSAMIFFFTGVTLRHVSADITHKNLVALRILETITAYTKSGTALSTHLKLHTRHTIMEDTQILWMETMHSFWTKFSFAESFDEPGGKGAFEMHHTFLYSFSLVRISEFPYTNFLSTCVWCTHLLKS